MSGKVRALERKIRFEFKRMGPQADRGAPSVDKQAAAAICSEELLDESGRVRLHGNAVADALLIRYII